VDEDHALANVDPVVAIYPVALPHVLDISFLVAEASRSRKI
jgi:hypothetical protein